MTRPLLFLLSATLAAAPAAAVGLTPQAVARQVRQLGADAVVRDLYRTGRWTRVQEGIARGFRGWIRLAPLLAPGTDAATTEDLAISLAEALPLAPGEVVAVLDLTGRAFPLAPVQVCTLPFIEGAPVTSRLATYKARAIARVGRVRRADLLPARDACLAALRAARVPETGDAGIAQRRRARP